METRTYHRKKLFIVLLGMTALFLVLFLRMWYIMVNRSQHYKERADDLHERERVIKAERGVIYDRNGVALATNKSVCTISVIHNQLKDPETVIRVLAETLDMEEEKSASSFSSFVCPHAVRHKTVVSVPIIYLHLFFEFIFIMSFP